MDERVASGESSKETTNSENISDEIILTKMDKFKKLFFSEVEWEAYLLEKIEQKEKARNGTTAEKKNSLLKRLKNLFVSSQECQKFLDEERKEYIRSIKKRDESEDVMTKL